jgi:murein peptide amidase A
MSIQIDHSWIGFRIFILVIICLAGVVIGNKTIHFSNRVQQVCGIHPLTVHAKEGYSTLEQLSFRSVKGREIKVYAFGNGKPTTLIIGGIHGDESSGVDLANALVKKFISGSMADFKGKVVVIPQANPDGLIAGTRVNARGIDINRNFPSQDFQQGSFKTNCYPGERAASEPETKAILRVVSQWKPKLIMSFHAELGCVNYDGPGAEIAQTISNMDGLPVRKDLGFDTPGSLGTYYGLERNIPVITLELLSKDNQWKRHGESILKVIGVGK